MGMHATPDAWVRADSHRGHLPIHVKRSARRSILKKSKMSVWARTSVNGCGVVSPWAETRSGPWAVCRVRVRTHRGRCVAGGGRELSKKLNFEPAYFAGCGPEK